MKRFKNSLVWKLTIWFLLLAVFPIVVMTVFMRQTIQEELLQLAEEDVSNRAEFLASQLASTPEDGPSRWAQAVTEAAGQGRSAAVVTDTGEYLAHSDPSLVGSSLGDNFPPALTSQLLAGGPASSFTQGNRIIGFAPLLPGQAPGSPIVIISESRAVVSGPLGRIERSALVQIGVSLLIVCVAGGTAIWVMFSPIQKLTRAAEAVGSGNLAVHVDTTDMEGELEVLTDSFNHMTRQLREVYDDLERRVEARTEELRESREMERRLAGETALLAEIGRLLSSTLNIDEVYDRFAQQMQKLVDFDRMAINVINPDGATFTFKYATGPVRPGYPVPEVRPLANTETERVMLTGRPLIISDVNEAPPFARNPEYRSMGLRSSIMVPLTSKGNVIGSMSLRSLQPGAYGERDRSILERLSFQIAPAIENAELYAQTRAAEQALRESEERYRTLFEQSTDAIFVASEGKIIEANQAAAAMFGYSLDEVIGLEVEQVYAHPEDRVRFHEELFQQGAVRDFEAKLYRKDGTEIDCLITAAIQRNSDGTNRRIHGVIRDITEQKQAEENQLQQTRELAVLEERNRMAREIHDTLAQGFTGIVLQMEAAEQALEESSAEASEHLSRAKSLARESLQEARRSVWNLLPHALEQLPLEAALEEEVHRFGVNAGWQHAEFKLLGKSWELPSNVQAGLLRICQESLSNAMKHAHAAKVDVELDFDPDGVSLSVRDDGQGFEPQQLGAMSTHGGFGLSGMEQRARLMGGELRIESEPGRGTLVAIRVPAGVLSV